LQTLKAKGFHFVVTGHSLGAGSASMLTILLRPVLGNVICFGFATPACVDMALSKESQSYVTSVVFRDDVVPRASVRSTKILLAELQGTYKNTWRGRFEEDKRAHQERLKQVWGPRSREAARRAYQKQQEQQVLEEEMRKNEEGTVSITPPATTSTGEPDNLREEIIQTSGLEKGKMVEKDIEKIQFPDLFVPGVVIHIYHCHGRYEAAVTDSQHESMLRLEVYSNMLDDHRGDNYFRALACIRYSRTVPTQPPAWEPFQKVHLCPICEAPFTWASTSTSQSQENMDKYNCCCCGKVVCLPCSQNERVVPKYGLFYPVRVCDLCYYTLENY